MKGHGWCNTHYERWRTTGDVQADIPVALRTDRKGQTHCSIEGCNKRHKTRGWCSAHYAKWKIYGDPLASAPPIPKRLCSVDGCDRVHSTHGYCAQHSRRVQKYGDPLEDQPIRIKDPDRGCAVENCDRDYYGNDFCIAHYLRVQKFGHPDADKPIKYVEPGRVCAVEGCEGKHEGFGYCASHYNRYRRFGDAEYMKTCPVCDEAFEPFGGKKYCSRVCATATRLRNHRRFERNIRLLLRDYAASSNDLRRGVYWLLAEKSDGLCVICGDPVDIFIKSGVNADPMGPSAEHLVPQSWFHEDDPRIDHIDNLGISHMRCNNLRRTRKLESALIEMPAWADEIEAQRDAA